MEYERIHKVQSGMISPTKLRIKLLGPHRKKDESNSNSPSKLVNSEFVNTLLPSNTGHFDDQDIPSMEPSDDANLDHLETNRMTRIDGVNSSAIHPVRMLEDENLSYSSNASSLSFEFDKGERSVQSALTRSHSRHVPSKWNDAEKWIVNKSALHNSAGRLPPTTNAVRVAPDCVILDRTLSGKTTGFGKFSFAACSMQPDSCPEEAGHWDKKVCMRDMGTEMTPTASLEPSRTATPAGATTPLRSPPSTPRGGEAIKELSEEEMKLEARKEIVALGIQLGKMSIAAWASKDGLEKNRSLPETKIAAEEELRQIENEKRAASWEEAENSRHMTRFKHEEIKIYAWESRRKAKLEAEMKKIEAQVEEIKARARVKAAKRIAMAGQRMEEKRVAREARERREAERIEAGTEYIRETGRFPTSGYICCGWF